MKKWLLGGASLVALGFGVVANAADMMPVKAPYLAGPASAVSEWEIDAGMRFWFSRGTIGAPNPLLNNPGNILASRLLYKDEDAFSGELYSRLDHSSGWFVKANAGVGRITQGNMFDEDFPAGGAYSNTLQNNNSGNLEYGNVDVGYTFLKSPGSKLGAFVGYGYYGQHVNTFGCTQLAGSSACQPPGSFPANFLGISEDNSFQSFRVGLSSQFMLTDRLKLTADVAWVPAVNFLGIDNHNARSLIINEASSNGDGVMLEAFLSYAVTNALNIGVGGRYWTWNMRDGTAVFNPFAGPVLNEPARYNTERYGVFTQASYHWGDVTPPAVSAGMLTKAPEMPTSWNGFYIGAHVGGGWGNDHWSDPFGTNFIAGGAGTPNVAGFGDSTHASGPLGGGQAGVDWQVGQAVYGLQADISGADLRGDNTCFSGLGGINCQHIVNAIGTFTGRLGLAWGHSLYYVKGGGAWTNTNYNLNGNTNALALGTASTNVNQGGWTVGGGVEYAFDRRWSAMLEYDHIGIGGSTVAFPTVAVVNAQSISIRQDIDMVKLGVNFKLN